MTTTMHSIVNIAIQSIMIPLWGYYFVKIAKIKSFELKHQAIVAAISVLLMNMLILFRVSMPEEVFNFFIVISNFIIILSFLRLISGPPTSIGVRYSYVRSLLCMGAIGVVGSVAQYVCRIL